MSHEKQENTTCTECNGSGKELHCYQCECCASGYGEGGPDACKKCNDSGFIEELIKCSGCKGHGTTKGPVTG